MRAVDLTPAEERGGGRGPSRTGNLPYVLLAGLALGLLGLVVLAFTSKQISDREAEVGNLGQELTAAEAKANALRPFAEFRAMQESRTATVTSLAQSRFDWERVINELSLVMPSDVWLSNLTGTVLPEVSVEGAADIVSRDTVAGPALELIGCAPSQNAVASFVAALEDIDGVTRVGVTSSERPEPDTDVAAGPSEDQEDCRTKDFINRFEIVVAFDAVPAPAGAVAPPPSVPAPLATPESGQLAASSTEQTGEAQQATDTFIPGG